MTEEQVLSIIENIANRLCYKFKFGYHDAEDMRQQARMFAVEAMERYDENRPLENFLWVHVRNRLFNFKRDNYERPDLPCYTCPFYDPHNEKSQSNCVEFSDKYSCDLYGSWMKRNSSKKNLMTPLSWPEVRDENENHMKRVFDIENETADREVLDIIDRKLPVDFRLDYLRLMNGLKLVKARRDKLVEKIKEILDSEEIDGQAWQAE